MHASGVGKALLAAMPDEAVRRIVGLHGLASLTDHTIISEKRLWPELARIRERGFAVDDEENAIGLRCVAAAILDENAMPVAAISLSGPTARIGDDSLEPLGKAVREAAGLITTALGGRKK
jgi:IclR family acetate operon transcriptional repressor